MDPHLLTCVASPFDQEEVDRLEHQQRVFDLVFDTRLIFPPIQEPQRILDCGYGAGAWAVEVAEQFPDCQVSPTPCIAF